VLPWSSTDLESPLFLYIHPCARARKEGESQTEEKRERDRAVSAV